MYTRDAWDGDPMAVGSAGARELSTELDRLGRVHLGEPSTRFLDALPTQLAGTGIEASRLLATVEEKQLVGHTWSIT